MAYTPPAQEEIRTKTSIDWLDNGELADELVLNRPINDVADMVGTLRDDAIVSDPVIAKNGATSQTVYQTFNFEGRVNFNGGSSAGDDAVAMAIALG